MKNILLCAAIFLAFVLIGAIGTDIYLSTTAPDGRNTASQVEPRNPLRELRDVLDPRYWARKDAERKRALAGFIAYSQPAFIEGHAKRLLINRRPFLYLVSAGGDDTDEVSGCILADNGRVGNFRHSSFGKSEGSGMDVNKAGIASLVQAPALPQGLKSPDSVPLRYVMAVGLRHGNSWETEYYDRRHLPAAVQTILSAVRR